MKLVKAKVWDINRHGKKYTRTFYLYVHKGVAPSVDKMFKEIIKARKDSQYMISVVIIGAEIHQLLSIA